jgi:diguanylate cyclase (GGDEF)-like protein
MSVLRFLLLEDNPLEAEVVRGTLTDEGIECEIQVVETRAQFEAALATQTYDLVLADYALPGFDGLTALEITQQRCPTLPFIFVTASLGEELAIESLKLGATDYVLKQRLQRLVPCVKRALKEAQEMRICQAAEADLAANLRHTELLRDLGARLVGERDIQTLYEEILTTAIAIMQADMGSLQRFEADHNTLHLLTYQGLPAPAAEFWQVVDMHSTSVCGQALVRQARIIVPDTAACEFLANTQDLAMFQRSGIRAVQTTPLISHNGHLMGMISTHWHQPHQPSEQDLRLIDLLARQAADLLKQRQTEAALQRYNEELEQQVAERTAALSQSLAEIEASKQQLHYQAHHDDLTGLPNRLAFHLRLEQSLQQAIRQQTKVAVVFMDVDRFKDINDSLGHRLGDMLLQKVAQRLHQVVRMNDTLGRLSGDEFVVVLVDIEEIQQVLTIVRRFTACFEAPFDLEGQTMHVTVSVGVCLFPDDGTNAEVLLRNADTAMYKAKAKGRNTFCFYEPAMTVSARQQVSLENALRLAIKREEFGLVYQPQVDLQSQTWVGLEVFLRWQHPKLGAVPPAQFIPIAERSGLISEMGVWVFKSVCLQAKVWLDQGLPFGRIAVNIAAPQLKNQHFIAMVQSALETSGCPATCLELEVTERLMMGQTAEHIQQLEQLQKLGIQLSIDDFGTGYSSLSYLKRLPIDKLKIDQSFVRDIPTDSNDMAIAEAIIALGKALSLKTIAEGVENQQQAIFLKNQGCHEAQGYFYSYPLPATAIEQHWRSFHQALGGEVDGGGH